MFKRFTALFLCAVLAMGILTGCDSKKNYENDCKTLEKSMKKLAKLDEVDDIDDEKEVKKFIKKISEIIEESETSTTEGEALKEVSLDFWDDYGKVFLTGGSESETEDMADALEDIIDAYDEFLDAAEDKGADIDDLENYEDTLLKKIR